MNESNPKSLSAPKNNQIYTLAQNETARMTNLHRNQPIMVNGTGTDLKNENIILNRAKRKMIAQSMVLKLIDVATEKNELSFIQPLWNTYHCLNTVYTKDGRLYGKYCKNRFCPVCTAIRKAEIINKYMSIIQTWDNPYLVTLTIKSVPAKSLNKMMSGMMNAFRTITNKYRKRNQRGHNIKLMGIKSLECNFNPIKKTYNPHFHLIVPNKQIAGTLIDEWIKICSKKSTKWVNKSAQQAQPIWDKNKALMEVVKYSCKIFTEPDVNNKSKQKGKRDIYILALFNIFCAMKGLRLFERFGFDLPKSSNSNHHKKTIMDNPQEWEYDAKQNDWINTKTGNNLTGYSPNHFLTILLSNNVDMLLE